MNQLRSPWVVIPTYNEKDNIHNMVEALFALSIPNLTVLVVDDSSPDGTGRIVEDLKARYPHLMLSTRATKDGLGRAYLHGFQYAFDHGSDAIVQMDADFSHDPKDVPRLLAALDAEPADMVIGSRYKNGISVINWPLHRLILSTSANTYAKTITGLPNQDITGGFRAWRAQALQKLDLHSVSADGYGFQIVMAHRAWKRKLRIAEIPIIFTERRAGQSKMSKAIVWEAFWLVWRLRLLG